MAFSPFADDGTILRVHILVFHVDMGDAICNYVISGKAQYSRIKSLERCGLYCKMAIHFVVDCKIWDECTNFSVSGGSGEPGANTILYAADGTQVQEMQIEREPVLAPSYFSATVALQPGTYYIQFSDAFSTWAESTAVQDGPVQR